MFEKIKWQLGRLGYAAIKDGDDIRIYSPQSSMAIAVLNTRTGDLTYTSYLMRQENKSNRMYLYSFLEDYQIAE